MWFTDHAFGAVGFLVCGVFIKGQDAKLQLSLKKAVEANLEASYCNIFFGTIGVFSFLRFEWLFGESLNSFSISALLAFYCIFLSFTKFKQPPY